MKKAEKYLREPYFRTLIFDKSSETFTAEILEFPGCVAQGATAQEAYERLDSVAASWIEAALRLGQEIPAPYDTTGLSGKVALRLPKTLHRQAAIAAEREKTSLNQFLVSAIAEKIGASNLYEQLSNSLIGAIRHLISRNAQELLKIRADIQYATTDKILPQNEIGDKLEFSSTGGSNALN